MHTTTRHATRAALLLALAGAAHAANYTITDLGTLGGPIVYASGVNDAGDAVGASMLVPSANYRGFSWAAGVQTDLGAPIAGNTQSHAFAINPSGVIVGTSYTLSRTTPRAFRVTSGLTEDLGPWAPHAINASGVIVGAMPFSNAVALAFEHACSYSGSTLTDLGTLGGSQSSAMGIDDLGRIVGGSFTTGDAAMHACLWQNAVALDLGTLGGPTSQAYAINTAGTVVGVSDTPAGGPAHAFAFTINGAGAVTARTDLGAPAGKNSAAYAINGAGVIVGTADYHAAIWENGVLTDLNTRINPASGWELQVASAISPGGRIAGWGSHAGFYRAFILTPPCPGDVTGDGAVNTADLTALLGHFGASVPAGTGGDLNADGFVNTADLTILLGSFGCGV